MTDREQVEARALLLRSRIREAERFVSTDDRFSERTLSFVLSLDADYVARLRLAGEGPPYCRLPADPGTRISYYLEDVAAWLVGLAECPGCRAHAIDR